MSEPDLSEFEDQDRIIELERLLASAQKALRRAKAKSEDLVEATLQGSRDAMSALGPMPKVPRPKADRGSGGEEIALWHLTDWQGSKTSETYNSKVMRERVLRFCDKAQRLTDIQRAHHPVRECVILFGGDMGEGLFSFPSQPFEIDMTIFEQFAYVARLEAEVVRRALATYEKVTVIEEWGNHGRIGSKRAAVPSSDNFDRMTYELARAMLTGEDRLTWEGTSQDVQHFKIGNYKALLIHGDEIGRNGFASPTTMVAHVTRWQSGAYPKPFRDVYAGHRHSHAEWSLPNGLGSFYQTGSTESDNRYASIGMAASSSPSQRLHFIDPDAGRVSAAYKVWLDT